MPTICILLDLLKSPVVFIPLFWRFPDRMPRTVSDEWNGPGSGNRRGDRILTQDGFFDPSQPLQVSLQANARYGSYAAIIEEDFPEGSTVTDISDGGQVIDGKLYGS